MTEEIIIDGVNVAGCNDFYKEWDNWSGKDNYRCQDFLSGMCAGNNCYYKQFKQAENTVNECHKYMAELEDKIERLEQENKELRAEIESFMNGDYCANGCKKMNNAFCDAHTAIIDKNNKLHSVLEEINLILDELEQQYDYMTDYSEIKEIQDKISEVLQ